MYCVGGDDNEQNSKSVPYIDIGSVIKAIESLPSSDGTLEKKPKRIAEIFVQKTNQYAKLIKQGHPNVYLLNAKEILTSDDFRWFNIGRADAVSPSEDHRDHKVIILMGATGSGKSTLIDGMINYIFGVKWKDSFRFKCVRDDNFNVINQTHSQTSSVTAYTVRHQEGMAVPYSITIIDTPGYGGTKGAKRDKEITRNIQQFLTQQKNRVDQIHVACFVAASGDSRLTATQRYTIDSIYSIFGKDVKENMRLLVTFADNSQPPVVDACHAANFPVTFPSAGITYSKFNSSVLYASNEQQDEEELSFDERFWNMSQENFYKFFTMLGGMNGRSRKSAPEVFQSRQLLEHSLEDMKRELADCLVNIENMETFRRQMREYGHKMDQFNDQVQISLMRSRAAEEQP
jgi:GTP-binding protein EngB required for normal cell division